MESEKRKEFLQNELLKLEANFKRQRGINTLELCRKKLGILLRLQEYEGVVAAGYNYIGSDGPDLIIQKFILVALCYNGHYEECLDVLRKWGTNYPTDFEKLMNIKHILEPFIQRAYSNISLPSSIFQNIEHILGLPIPTFESDIQAQVTECRSWKYRPPPTQTVTYFLCPRISNAVPCLFGDNCLAAHSKEELEEWKARNKNETLRKNSELRIEVESRTPSSKSQQLNHPFRTRSNECRGPRLGTSFTPYANWLPEPPQNTPYLNHLIKDYCDHSSLSDFWPNVDGVKLTWSGPLQINTTSLVHVWTVLVRSQRRDTLRTVSLLHDMDRINFRISEAYFCEDSNYTVGIDLMKSNICNHKNALKLQVLSTFIPPKCLNRPWYYYRMGFTFRAIGPGDFAQTVVYDFKEKPKLIQHLAVHVIKDGGQKLLNIPQAGVSSSTSSTSSISTTQAESNTQLLFHQPNHQTENKIETSFPLGFGRNIWSSFEGRDKIIPLSSTNHLQGGGSGSMFATVQVDSTRMPNGVNVLMQRPFSTVLPNSIPLTPSAERDNRNLNLTFSTSSTEPLPQQHDSTFRTRVLCQAPDPTESYINGLGHIPLRRRNEPPLKSDRSSGSNSGSENDSPVSFDETTERRSYVSPISRPKHLLMPSKMETRILNSSLNPLMLMPQPMSNHVNRDSEPSTKSLLPTPPNFFSSQETYPQQYDHPLHRNIYQSIPSYPFSNRNICPSQPYRQPIHRHLENDRHFSFSTNPASKFSSQYTIPQHETYFQQMNSLRSRVEPNQNLSSSYISYQPFERNMSSSLFSEEGIKEKNKTNDKENNWSKFYPKSIHTLKENDNEINCFDHFIDRITKNLNLNLTPSDSKSLESKSISQNDQFQSNFEKKVNENEINQKDKIKLNATKERSAQMEEDQSLWLNSSDFPPITKTIQEPREANSDWVKVRSRKGGSHGKKNGSGQGVTSSVPSHVTTITTTSKSSSQQVNRMSSSGSENRNAMEMERIVNLDYLKELCSMGFAKKEVLHVLQKTNNSPHMAIDILLASASGSTNHS